MSENQNTEVIQSEIERLKKATGLQDKEDTFFGKLEETLMAFSSIETEDLLQALQNACGEDAPDLDELRESLRDEVDE